MNQKEKKIDDKVEKIRKSLENLNNKNFRILIFSPSIGGPSGGIGVLYQHVKVLRELGYDAQILNEKDNSGNPEKWLGDKYQGLPHVSLESTKLQVSPEDFFIIPEGISPIMEQTRNLSCKRIILVQSWYYILNSLMPGSTWKDFGLRDCVVVTSTIKKYIENVFGEDNQNIKVCKQYIDDDIFYPSKKPQKPFIAISSRDQMQGLNLIKHFYLIFPQYRWISFRDMKGMDRETFAETLRECCLSVWLDKVAGFGTFPIESAKSGVPVIALIPEIVPEYANEKNAIWTNDLLSIPNLIGNLIKLWLEDSVPLEIVEGTKELALKYSEDEGKKEIERTYRELVNERRDEFSTFINSNREITQSMISKQEEPVTEEVK